VNEGDWSLVLCLFGRFCRGPLAREPAKEKGAALRWFLPLVITPVVTMPRRERLLARIFPKSRRI
jgi:hypothetical protein